MVGEITNSQLQREHVALIEVEADFRQCRFLVARHEYMGGKVFLRVFDPRTRNQVHPDFPFLPARGITRVLEHGDTPQYPDIIEKAKMALMSENCSERERLQAKLLGVSIDRAA